MFRPPFVIVFAALAASPAFAISRYDTPSMTCSAVQRTIDQEGAAILRYPSTRVKNMTLYDRYVRNSRQCEFGENAERTTVPTRDRQNCSVYHCEPRCSPSAFRDC